MRYKLEMSSKITSHNSPVANVKNRKLFRFKDWVIQSQTYQIRKKENCPKFRTKEKSLGVGGEKIQIKCKKNNLSRPCVTRWFMSLLCLLSPLPPVLPSTSESQALEGKTSKTELSKYILKLIRYSTLKMWFEPLLFII